MLQGVWFQGVSFSSASYTSTGYCQRNAYIVFTYSTWQSEQEDDSRDHSKNTNNASTRS